MLFADLDPHKHITDTKKMAQKCHSDLESINFDKDSTRPAVVECVTKGYRFEDSLFVRRLILDGVGGFGVFNYTYRCQTTKKARSTSAGQRSKVE